jgi:hypothetical protein
MYTICYTYTMLHNIQCWCIYTLSLRIYTLLSHMYNVFTHTRYCWSRTLSLCIKVLSHTLFSYITTVVAPLWDTSLFYTATTKKIQIWDCVLCTNKTQIRDCVCVQIRHKYETVSCVQLRHKYETVSSLCLFEQPNRQEYVQNTILAPNQKNKPVLKAAQSRSLYPHDHRYACTSMKVSYVHD